MACGEEKSELHRAFHKHQVKEEGKPTKKGAMETNFKDDTMIAIAKFPFEDFSFLVTGQFLLLIIIFSTV